MPSAIPGLVVGLGPCIIVPFPIPVTLTLARRLFDAHTKRNCPLVPKNTNPDPARAEGQTMATRSFRAGCEMHSALAAAAASAAAAAVRSPPCCRLAVIPCAKHCDIRPVLETAQDAIFDLIVLLYPRAASGTLRAIHCLSTRRPPNASRQRRGYGQLSGMFAFSCPTSRLFEGWRCLLRCCTIDHQKRAKTFRGSGLRRCGYDSGSEFRQHRTIAPLPCPAS